MSASKPLWNDAPTIASYATELRWSGRRASASTSPNFSREKGRPFPQIFSSAKRTYFARQIPARTAEAPTSRPSGRTRKRATRLAPRRLLWNIEGQRGRIYSIPGPLGDPGREGFQFFLACDSGLAWKRPPKFAKVCNDSDEGGGFSMHRLPTKAEAETIGGTAAFPSDAR
jgi:hypothetical protein